MSCAEKSELPFSGGVKASRSANAAVHIHESISKSAMEEPNSRATECVCVYARTREKTVDDGMGLVKMIVWRRLNQIVIVAFFAAQRRARGGVGRALAAAAAVTVAAAALRLLKVHELVEQGDVGADVGGLVFHLVVGSVHGHVLGLHDPGNEDGGRPGDAALAVHQHLDASVQVQGDEGQEGGQGGREIAHVVRERDVEVAEGWEAVGGGKVGLLGVG